jgi:hypothetical protein
MDNLTPKGTSFLQKLPFPPLISLLLLLAVVVSISVSVYFLSTSKNFEPFSKAFNLKVKKPTVTLKTGSKNPFNKETQFVNPFDPVKSPFYALKKKAEEKK